MRGFARADVGAKSGHGFLTAVGLDLGTLSSGKVKGDAGAFIAELDRDLKHCRIFAFQTHVKLHFALVPVAEVQLRAIGHRCVLTL